MPDRGSGSRRRRKPSEMTIRQRSQSGAGGLGSSKTPTAASFDAAVAATAYRAGVDERRVAAAEGGMAATAAAAAAASTTTLPRDVSRDSGPLRPAMSRTTSAKLSIPPARSVGTPVGSTPPRAHAHGRPPLGSNAAEPPWGLGGATGPYVPFPPLDKASTAPDVDVAPASGMYWTRAPVSGVPHTALRAHTTTAIGSNVYVFGGCDSRACFNQLYVLDGDTFHWSTPHVTGAVPIPLRAMTCTAVNKRLVIFGGGDGPAYYNDVYVLDTLNFRWSKPRIVGDRIPSKRRAHTACLYKTHIYVFGGGDGVRALNDIWRLDVSDPTKMSWRQVSGPDRSTSGSLSSAAGGGGGGGDRDRDALRPKARGYHTANIVGNKIVVFGGSDGGECFDDVWVYSLDRQTWQQVVLEEPYRRLSHTATLVGSYLFVVGGHDGEEYSNAVLLLNLTTMTWESRRTYGALPAGRGYHTAVLHDGRLVVIGGFDGTDVFGDVWVLELAVHAYYSQICHFTIVV
jgi:N-acetylneuraminic acid mutarotase